MSLSEIDYIVIAFYIAFNMLIGLWPISKDVAEEFLISGRNLSGISSGFTIAASKIGAGAIVTYGVLFFTFGMGAIWMYAGYIFGYVVFYIFAIRLHKESRLGCYYTLADYFQAHYGKCAAVAIGIVSTLSLSGWVLTNMIAGGKLLAYCFGWPFQVSLCVVAIIVFSYLYAGGFRAVVRTDFIQYASILVLLVFLGIVVLVIEPAPHEPAEFAPMKLGKIISFFVIGLFFPMGSVELWQRVYAARNKESLKRGILIASFSFVVIVGALSVLFFKLAEAGISLDSNDVDVGLFSVVALQLPRGVIGLWFIAFVSAVVSSADTFMFTTSCSGVIDVWERVFGTQIGRRVSRVRILLIIVVIFGVLGSMILRNIVDVTFVFAGITMGLGVISFTAWVYPTVPRWGIVIACILANLGAVIQAIISGISATTAVTNLAIAFVAVWTSILADSVSTRWRRNR